MHSTETAEQLRSLTYALLMPAPARGALDSYSVAEQVCSAVHTVSVVPSKRNCSELITYAELPQSVAAVHPRSEVMVGASD